MSIISDILKAYSTPEGPHDWVCKTSAGNAPLQWEVVSDADYRANPKKYSRIELTELQYYCKQESVQIVNGLNTHFQDVVKTLSGLIHRPDVFSEDMGAIATGLSDKINTRIQERKDLLDPIKKAGSIFDTMISKKTDKKNNEYNASWWGAIKWVIWHVFCDYTASMKSTIAQWRTITRQLEIQNGLILNMTTQELKNRIIVNMSGFEECVGLRKRWTLEDIQAGRADSDLTPDASDPKEVQRNWLRKYHSDKFQLPDNLSEENKKEADICFKRVVLLNKVWQNLLNKIEEDKANNPAPTNIPTTTRPPQSPLSLQ